MPGKIKRNYICNAAGVVLLFLLLMAAFELRLFGTSTNYMKGIATTACYTIIMVTSLNLLVGILGEFSLGHAGFMSVGAYASAILTNALANQGIPDLALFVIALAAGGVAAAVAGIVSGEPGLIILPLPQLFIALELKGAEVDLPESGESLAVGGAIDGLQGLAGAEHPGGTHPAALGLGVAPLGGPAVEGIQPRGAEGQIGLAAVKTLLVGHGGPVAEEIDLLLSHGLRPLSAPGGCRRTGG